jgi:hypothetical protein
MNNHTRGERRNLFKCRYLRGEERREKRQIKGKSILFKMNKSLAWHGGEKLPTRFAEV